MIKTYVNPVKPTGAKKQYKYITESQNSVYLTIYPDRVTLQTANNNLLELFALDLLCMDNNTERDGDTLTAYRTMKKSVKQIRQDIEYILFCIIDNPGNS